MSAIIDLCNSSVVQKIEWSSNSTIVKIVLDKTQLTKAEMDFLYEFDQKDIVTGNTPERRKIVEENMRKRFNSNQLK